jgi:hypothetical protein
MSIKKNISTFIIIICCLLTVRKSFGQEYHRRPDTPAAPKQIALIDFNQRVDRAIKLLETKKLSAISDSDHINIMMCINTVFLSDLHKKKSSDHRYMKLLVLDVNYSFDIRKVYPDYMFNTGMGYYFPKLKMELNGVPAEYAYFEIQGI